MMRGWNIVGRTALTALFCTALAFCAVFSPQSCKHQRVSPKGDFEWVYSLSGKPPPVGTAVAHDSEGNIVACGSSRDYGEGYPFILKCSPQGKLLWEKRFKDEERYLPGPMGVDGAGNIYCAGDFVEAGGNERKIFTLKLSKEGELIWARSWGTPGGCLIADLCVGNDGGVFVTGDYSRTSTAFVLNYSAEGDLLWAKAWELEQYGNASAVAQDREGDLLVACSRQVKTKDKLDFTAAVIGKLSPKGKWLWTRLLIVTPPKEYGEIGSEATSLATDDEGNVYLGGSEGYKLLLAKLSSDGRLLWQTTWSHESTYFAGLSLSGDGVYILGSCYSDMYPPSIALLKFSPTGVLLWQAALSRDPKKLEPAASCPGHSCLAMDDAGSAYMSWLGLPSNVYWVRLEGWMETWPMAALDDSLEEATVNGTGGIIALSLYSPKPSRIWHPRSESFMLAKVNTQSWDFENPPVHSPKYLKATAISPSEIQLSWETADKGGLGYIVERRTAASMEWEQVSKAYASMSYRDLSVEAQTEYTYRIKAYNAAGESPYSDEAAAVTFSNPDKLPRGVEWLRRVNIGNNGKLSVCAVSMNGDLVAAGAEDKSMVVARYTPEGSVKWITKYESDKASRQLFEVTGISFDGPGNIIVSGTYGLGEGNNDALTMKLSPCGEMLWCKAWGSHYNELVTGVGTDGEGNVYVAGKTLGFHSKPTRDSGYASTFLLQYSPEGNLRWDSVYGEDFSDTTANGMYVRPDGHAFVVGHYLSFHYDDESGPLLAEFTPDGNVASSCYWKLEDFGEFDYIAPGGNKDFYIYGISSKAKGTRSHALALKYSLIDGNIWGKRITLEGEAPSICPIPSGLVFACGYGQPAFLQLSSRGDLLSAFQLGVSPDFSVNWFAEGSHREIYVVGVSEQLYLSAFPLETIAENWSRKSFKPTWPRVTLNNPVTDKYDIYLKQGPVKAYGTSNCFVMKLDYPEFVLGARKGN